MKRLFFLLFPVLLLAGCEIDSDYQQTIQQEKILKQSSSQTGMPAIKNFQERKLMKMILELRDQENLITYTYIVNQMTGKLVFIGKSIGYGLPYATQYTNPEKYELNGATLPQADPNGLFSPSSAAGTWILLINPKTGQPKPVYFEPEIVVSPFLLN